MSKELDLIRRLLSEAPEQLKPQDKNIKDKDAEKVFENNDWLIVIPKTHEASCKYGAGTRWCTAQKDLGRMFKRYENAGPLYYVISKTERNTKGQPRKYGFHFNGNIFIDENNNTVANIVTIGDWINKNLGKDVYVFFNKEMHTRIKPLDRE